MGYYFLIESFEEDECLVELLQRKTSGRKRQVVSSLRFPVAELLVSGGIRTKKHWVFHADLQLENEHETVTSETGKAAPSSVAKLADKVPESRDVVPAAAPGDAHLR